MRLQACPLAEICSGQHTSSQAASPCRAASATGPRRPSFAASMATVDSAKRLSSKLLWSVNRSASAGKAASAMAPWRPSPIARLQIACAASILFSATGSSCTQASYLLSSANHCTACIGCSAPTPAACGRRRAQPHLQGALEASQDGGRVATQPGPMLHDLCRQHFHSP